MAHEPRTYATASAYCGHHAQPGVTRMQRGPGFDAARDHARTQAHIEAVLETLAIMGASLLHVGIGNSQLAQRFASRARHIDGLTVPHMKRPMRMPWGSPITPCMCSMSIVTAFDAVLTQPYDVIIDNNLASFACCHAHFSVMLAQYARLKRARRS